MRSAAPLRSVLIVEDDAIVALDLEQQVRARGLRVLGPYYSGAAAVEALAGDPPDLAIVDYHLTDGRADRLAAALHAATIPFAIVSVSDAVDLPDGIEALGLFSKPFDTDILSAMIAAAPPQA